MNKVYTYIKDSHFLKKVLAVFLAVAMVVTYSNITFPEIAWGDYSFQAEQPKAWIASHPDGAKDDLRVSQLLKIETSGFDRNAYLKYDLYGTSWDYEIHPIAPNFSANDEIIKSGYLAAKEPLQDGIMGSIMNPSIEAANMLRQEHVQTEYPYFYVAGNTAKSINLKVTITDTNPTSPTYLSIK